MTEENGIGTLIPSKGGTAGVFTFGDSQSGWFSQRCRPDPLALPCSERRTPVGEAGPGPRGDSEDSVLPEEQLRPMPPAALPGLLELLMAPMAPVTSALPYGDRFLILPESRGTHG